MGLRNRFSEQEIKDAWDGAQTYAGTAKALTALGRGEVTRQLAKYWVKHLPKLLAPARVPEVGEAQVVEGPRILFIDIETSPIMAAVWSLWQNGVGLNQVHGEWYIMSVAWKWLHDNAVGFESTRNTGEDDTELLRTIWELLDEADIVIAHNGRKFDMKKINARFLLAEFPPPSPYKVVDTLEFAKRHFAFTSNKLDWLSTNLTDAPKDHHDEFPGYMLWKECLAGNPRAWDCMEKYNRQDVVSLEKVYLKLRAWAEGHVNVAAYFEDEKIRCPKCGSTHIEKVGLTHTQTGQYYRYQCNSCKGFSRSRYTLNSKEKRQALLSN